MVLIMRFLNVDIMELIKNYLINIHTVVQKENWLRTYLSCSKLFVPKYVCTQI